MIKVYQIQLTVAEIGIIRRDREHTPRIKAYFDREFERTFKPENFEYYTHVANVDTDDMEEAFRLMNLWDDESLVEKLCPCFSMSIGDILVLENGQRYRVASFGFKLI